MSEMIERAAKAIYEARNGYGCKPWSLLPRSHKEPYIGDALAVIKAMREPTADMLCAVVPHPLHLVIERDDAQFATSMEAATAADRISARSTYQGFIDAVLADSPHGE